MPARAGPLFRGGHGTSANRGIAYVAVLWAVALLALLASVFVRSVRTDVSLVRNLQEQAEAQALAEAGMALAVKGLATATAAGGLRADGTVYEMLLGDGRLRFSIQDEDGKIDLNAAPRELIEAHLRHAGSLEESRSGALADAVIDFRDPDDLKRLEGAEARDYAAAGSRYRPKNAPYATVGELAGVLGMDQAIYRSVADGFTVHSRSRRPDWTVAAPSLRRWLPEALKQRGEQPDDGRSAHAPALPLQVLDLGPTARRSDLGVFTIHAEGMSDGGGRFAVDCTVKLPRDGGPHAVLEWSQAESYLFTEQGG